MKFVLTLKNLDNLEVIVDISELESNNRIQVEYNDEETQYDAKQIEQEINMLLTKIIEEDLERRDE